jgi:hypothetical protein
MRPSAPASDGALDEIVYARRMRLGPSAAVAAMVSVLFVVTPARAQTDDATRLTARTLAESGLTLVEQGDYPGALEKFDRALTLIQVPTVGVRAARCLVKLGRLVEASERYRQAAAMTIDPTASAAFRQSQAEAQAEAETERAALLKRIPRLEIALEGAAPADVELTIDGKPAPTATIGIARPMDPGSHRLTVRRGADTDTRDGLLKEGESQRVVLKLPPRAAVGALRPSGPGPTPPLAPRPGSTQRLFASITMGAGGAAVVVGGVTFLLALGKKGDLDRLCQDQTCHADATDTLSAYNTMRTVSTVTWVGGGVLLAGGVIAYLTAPSSGPPRAAAAAITIAPWIGPGSAGFRGVF